MLLRSSATVVVARLFRGGEFCRVFTRIPASKEAGYSKYRRRVFV
jgi:hypothetical protein